MISFELFVSLLMLAAGVVNRMFRRLMAAPLGCQCNQRLQIIRGSKSKTSTRKRDPKQSLGRDVWMAKTGRSVCCTITNGMDREV